VRLAAIGAITAVLLCGAIAPATAGAPIPAVACANLETGAPGPAGNVLQISLPAGLFAGVVRTGDQIEVQQADHRGGRPSVDCSGPPPTVTNIDTVRVDVPSPNGGAETDFFVDLGGGELAPGATPESDGASEIEIRDQAKPDPEIGYIEVMGTPGADVMTVRNPNDSRLEADLDGSGPSADPEISMHEPGEVDIEGGPGDDHLSILGHGPFEISGLSGNAGDDTLRANGAITDGGSGDDVEAGGDLPDFLKGESGDDRLYGEGGIDHIGGGPGSDVLKGGHGADRLRARDGRGDRVDCGTQRDTASVDRHDLALRCERLSR
jgi:Ca2+-binding RTX toxin-like protein